MQFHLLNTTKSSANTYIVFEGNKAVVIDPGFDSAPIFEYVQNNGLEIGLVMLTHGHPDHCYCVGDFTKYGIKTYIAQADFELIKQFNGKLPGLNARELFTAEFYPADGKIVYGGIELTIIPAPGHSAGGVCIACGDYLFTGDTLFNNTVGRTDYPTGSEEQLYRTLNRLFSLKKDYTVLPGHGWQTTLSYEREHNPFADKAKSIDKI